MCGIAMLEALNYYLSDKGYRC